MVVTTIDAQHMIRIPDDYQKALPPGKSVALSIDAQGRLLVTPVEQLQAILHETFGLWSDRPEAPRDGTEWVDAARRGRRLDALISGDDEDP